jgi:hypothetical protein
VTSYPTFDEVIADHAQLIARFGGSLGIRDRGALESALARSQSGYYNDSIHEAAALWVGLYETGRLRFKELETWLRKHAISRDDAIR